MTLILYSPTFWVALIAGALALLLIAWQRRLRWRPAWLLRTLLLGAVLLGALTPQTRPPNSGIPTRQVLIVDQSDSLTPGARGLLRTQARTWLAGGENRIVIVAGAQAAVFLGDEWPDVDGTGTDLAAALQLAGDLLDADPGRVILASDGGATDPLAFESALETLSLEGHTLDVIPADAINLPTDLYVGPLYLPPTMWENSPFTAVLPVYVPQKGEVTLRLTRNEESILEETVTLPAGPNLIPFDLQTFKQEILTLSATVTFEGDPRPENNTAYAGLRVFPAPSVLIVTEDAETAGILAAALDETGLETDLISPAALPASLSDLDPYQVIILHNFLAVGLTEAQMRTLKDHVSQMGRGLVFLGGRNAYTLGGYKNTILEPILPVKLKPPPREQNTPLTFVLVFDRSASMAPQLIPNHLRPITLAREAAIRAVERLGPEDYFGILTYNSNPSWTIRIGLVGEGLALQRTKDAISQVNAAGGTSIFKALNTAVAGLLETPTSETRHILLLSDGQSSDGTLEEFVALAKFAHEQGISVSTIALGVEADQELMALIAQAGRGRYYPVLQATDLPKILIDESQAARGENVHEGETRPIQGEPNHPILSGFRIALMPSVSGYNALESKAGEGAEDVLLSGNFEDPLLSVWQYGLGRVAAWTSDTGEEWGDDWVIWDEWGRFWSQVIRYALPDPALGPGQVEVDAGTKGVAIRARIRTPAGVPLNALQVVFSYAGAEGQVHTFQVPQTGPGLYELSLPRPGEGVYRGVVSYKPPDESTRIEIAAPLAVDYPPEWQPADPEAGLANLESWAESTGGSVVAWEDASGDRNRSSEAVPPPRLEPNQILQRLILGLIVFWPVEIAIRRRWMPWR
ncbi:MAG: VWA domain-containing protein [Anaerolineales bacterium]